MPNTQCLHTRKFHIKNRKKHSPFNGFKDVLDWKRTLVGHCDQLIWFLVQLNKWKLIAEIVSACRKAHSHYVYGYKMELTWFAVKHAHICAQHRCQMPFIWHAPTSRRLKTLFSRFGNTDCNAVCDSVSLGKYKSCWNWFGNETKCIIFLWHSQFYLLIFHQFHDLRAWIVFDSRTNDNFVYFKKQNNWIRWPNKWPASNEKNPVSLLSIESIMIGFGFWLFVASFLRLVPLLVATLLSTLQKKEKNYHQHVI